jgi:hypothetical protein
MNITEGQKNITKGQTKYFKFSKKSFPKEAVQRKQNGAGNETRTRDPDLGKVVLYQLSYSRKWRPQGESNPCYRRERAVS